MSRRTALGATMLVAAACALLVHGPRADASDPAGSSAAGPATATLTPPLTPPLTPQSAAARVPVLFEANRGQAPEGWDFLVRAHGYRAFVRSDEILFSFGGAPLRMTHDGAARGAPDVRGFETEGRVNYLIGDDRAQWLTGIPVTSGATYHDEARCASWTADGDGRSMRLSWTVEGEDEPSFRLGGAEAVRVERDGSLRAVLPTGEASLTAPVAWQETAGARRPVGAAFVLGEGGAVRVALGERDPSRTTFVDPVVDFVSYFGGSAEEKLVGVALDDAGGTYLAGHTKSTGIPASSGAHATAHASDGTKNDWFLVKFASNGRNFVWCTYFGGNASDDLLALGVVPSGEAVLIGNSNSTNLPTTARVIGPTNIAGATLGAVTRFNTTGTGLVACTYFPLGSLVGGALAGSGQLYLVGADNVHKVMATLELAPDDSKPPVPTYTTIWSRRVTPATHTGSESTTLVGVATGGSGEAIVYAVSNDTSFTTTSGAYQAQPTSGGSKDVLLVEYDGDGNLAWSTFLGGSGDDSVNAVVIDPLHRPLVLGSTNSDDFPVAGSPWQDEKDAGYDAFVTHMGSNGKLLQDSTFLGGSGDERATAGAIHASGATYVGGTTTSSDFPLKDAPQSTYAGGTNGDGFVAVYDSSRKLATSSYVGGTGDDAVTCIAVRPDSTVVVAGTTTSTNLPVTNAYQYSYGGGIDGWYVQASDPLVGTLDAPRILTTQADIPEWTVGLGYQVAIETTDGWPPYSFAVTGGTVPPGTTLAEDGTLSGTLSSAGTYAFDVTVSDSHSVRGYARYAVTVNVLPVVTTAAVPDVTRATPFDFQIVSAFGTTGPAGLAFTLDSGALPQGLGLSASGRITGTPTILGPSTFAVRVTDDVGATATKEYTVTVRELPSIDEATLSPWTENRAWVQSFTAQDGTPPLTWSVAAGAAPIAGGIDPSSGKIQGTTKPAGNYDFTLRVRDARGAIAERAFSLVVNPFPEILTLTLPPAAVGRPYAAFLRAGGGTDPGEWMLDAGVLPTGIALTEDTGAVEGSPTKAGTSFLSMIYTDASGASLKRTVHFDTASALDVRKRTASFSHSVGIGGSVRAVRWLELVAGTQLSVTLKGGGVKRVKPSLHLIRPDASEVDLAGYLKTTAKGATLKKFPVPETGRWFLAVEAAPDFRGKMSVATSVSPAAKWTQTVTVDSGAEPVEALFAAPKGTRVTVTVAPAKRSTAKPVIVDVLDGQGQSLLGKGKVTTSGKTVTFTLKRPAAGGDHKVLLSSAEGFPGKVVWTAKLSIPQGYAFALPGVPAGDEEP